MHGTKHGSSRRKVTLRPEARNTLDAFLTARDLKGFEARAEYLKVGRSSLHRAWTGEPVSAGFICAVLSTVPGATYDDFFTGNTEPADELVPA